MILRGKLPCRSGNRKLVSSTLELTKRNSSNYFRNYTKLITFCRLTRHIAPNQIPSPETPPQYFSRQIGSGEFAGTVWRLMDSGHRSTLIGHSTHLGHSPARLRSARLGSARLIRLVSVRLRSASGPSRVRLDPSRRVSVSTRSVSVRQSVCFSTLVATGTTSCLSHLSHLAPCCLKADRVDPFTADWGRLGRF